jgi:hypothetical protein
LLDIDNPEVRYVKKAFLKQEESGFHHNRSGLAIAIGLYHLPLCITDPAIQRIGLSRRRRAEVVNVKHIFVHCFKIHLLPLGGINGIATGEVIRSVHR